MERVGFGIASVSFVEIFFLLSFDLWFELKMIVLSLHWIGFLYDFDVEEGIGTRSLFLEF